MSASATFNVNDFPIEERKIGQFSVDSVTNAPLQIEVKLKLNIPQEKAFKLVFENLHTWLKEINGIIWDNSNSLSAGGMPGQNSLRECGFGKNKLYEKIVFCEAPKAYGYVVDMEKSTAKFPVKNPLGIFLVERLEENSSIVSWRQYFNKKFHPAALIIKPVVKNTLMKKNFKNLIKEYGGEFIQ